MTAPDNPTVWLTLQAHDPAALVDFLVEVLGFVLTTRSGDGDALEHAELVWPEGFGGVMLGPYRSEGPWNRMPGSAGGYLVVSNPQEHYERIVAADAEVIIELRDTSYGSQEFAVRDPEGNLWSFGTYRGADRSA